MSAPLPNVFTPDTVAAHLGVSERTLRDMARQLGACRMFGNRMILTEGDVQLIMEAARCPTPSTGAAKSGTTGGLSPGGDYAALAALRTKPSPKGSQRKPKAGNGSVISMDRRRT
jgi:hypothetical protein